MKTIIATVAAALLCVSSSQAGQPTHKPQNNGHKPNHVQHQPTFGGFHGNKNHGGFNSGFKNNHHQFHNHHVKHGTPFGNQWIFKGQHHNHWSHQRWCPTYGCRVYWCPSTSVYYYWNSGFGGYYPYSHLKGTPAPLHVGPAPFGVAVLGK